MVKNPSQLKDLEPLHRQLFFNQKKLFYGFVVQIYNGK